MLRSLLQSPFLLSISPAALAGSFIRTEFPQRFTTSNTTYVRINAGKLREFKDGVVGKLTSGLAGMAKQRKVTVFEGNGTFTSPSTMKIDSTEENQEISFANAIIAAGSQSTELPLKT